MVSKYLFNCMSFLNLDLYTNEAKEALKTGYQNFMIPWFGPSPEVDKDALAKKSVKTAVARSLSLIQKAIVEKAQKEGLTNETEEGVVFKESIVENPDTALNFETYKNKVIFWKGVFAVTSGVVSAASTILLGGFSEVQAVIWVIFALNAAELLAGITINVCLEYYAVKKFDGQYEEDALDFLKKNTKLTEAKELDKILENLKKDIEKM